MLERLKQIGPAIVVAAVVLGPGSIVNASRVGCGFGYELLWVVPMAGLLMMAMTIAAMRIGALDEATPCERLRQHFGRPASLIVGVSLMVAVTLFQASNNHAIIMATEGLMRGAKLNLISSVILLALLNVGVISLLYLGRRSLYRIIERSMTVFVGIMLLAFVVSMLAAKPAIADILAGLVPDVKSILTFADSGSAESSVKPINWMSVSALVATTFSVAGAFYQTYQVREKGWKQNDLRTGSLDAIVGIATLTLITMVLVITSATALHGRIESTELDSAAAVASQLEPLFGAWASIVFSLGVVAGALSSFVVNALIGGVVMSDAMGKESRFDSLSVRMTTTVALLLGFAISVTAMILEINLVNFIVIAQSLTVIAFPILALAILWLLIKLPSDGIVKSRMPIIVGVSLGLFVVLALTVRTIIKLIPNLS